MTTNKQKELKQMSRCKKHDYYSIGSYGKYTKTGFYMGSQEHLKCSNCGGTKKTIINRRYK